MNYSMSKLFPASLSLSLSFYSKAIHPRFGSLSLFLMFQAPIHSLGSKSTQLQIVSIECVCEPLATAKGSQTHSGGPHKKG